MSAPGFEFWGLFLMCAAVLVAYWLWLRWTERR